ncbi:hypothetical protein P5Y53_04125 [Dyella jiangningensis]|uniref:hypothetical protein n=1 Tax=Dyella jiangningensis TaxID=1379159 RepID=UPI0024109B27|nr:hypothetical protein [Dyella jiangningensis]MDG2536838.1 hypothetical protein [Dyella jiangningensis]
MQFDALREVVQEDEWGCGVACVASILAVSYARARQLLVRHKKAKIDADESQGLELHHLALALRDGGFPVVADWDEPKPYQPGTIVLIGRARGGVEHEHYIVSVGGGWFMDPWINYPNENRQAGLRESFPKGKIFYVALVPKPGSYPR